MIHKKAATTPAPINVTVNGITGRDLLIAAFLALAVIAAALIIHHGLTA
jgi:hypothetical protein